MCCSQELYPPEHYIDQDSSGLRNSPLTRDSSCPPEIESDPEPTICTVQAEPQPDLEVLRLHAPRTRSDFMEDFPEGPRINQRAMSAPTKPARTNDIAPDRDTKIPPGDDSGLAYSPLVLPPDQNEELKNTAATALAIQGTNQISEDAKRPERVDSGRVSQESVPQITTEQRQQIQSSGTTPPPRAQNEPSPPRSSTMPHRDSIVDSPILRKNMVQVEPSTAATLPGVQQATSPMHDGAGTPLRDGSLPGFQQLANLADIAAQQATQLNTGAQSMARTHSQSFSSTTSTSPMLPYHTPSYTNSAQTSPVSYHGFHVRSPTSTTSDGPYNYGSPHQYPPQAYYADRRSSTAGEPGRPYPPPVPSLPSNSSSVESYGTNASSSDGYSTARTTPLESSGTMPPDNIQHRILPPPLPGMSVIPADGFRCDYPGCNAQSFQTQYLLSSHQNVHSQIRPHYCPVKDCPRSEGGKGFKRKNEMIRHGLVHNSPGYICPFCPDREHRYPRPDNLQRHVRVHHVDKDKDDPALREVLAQRCEGSIQKQRRRRMQTNGSQMEE